MSISLTSSTRQTLAHARLLPSSLVYSTATCSPTFRYSYNSNFSSSSRSSYTRRGFSTTRTTDYPNSKMAGDKSNITSWASNDGSFKRQTSSFRDVIEKGGKFEPEKGALPLFNMRSAAVWGVAAI